ncbi:hypothetical protein Z946_2610 [Sulfitobacter noctilucicola]|nr:hypothetical protein Z946_2610 [Sulfitobacter noctilucicola]
MQKACNAFLFPPPSIPKAILLVILADIRLKGASAEHPNNTEHQIYA